MTEQFIICLLGFCGIVVLVKCIWILHRHTIQLNKKTPTTRASRVHFYIARDKYNNLLYLYLGKPIKGIDRFHACHNGCIVSCANSCSSCANLSDFGLNPKDFENLKFEDEPVEVFLNLE